MRPCFLCAVLVSCARDGVGLRQQAPSQGKARRDKMDACASNPTTAVPRQACRTCASGGQARPICISVTWRSSPRPCWEGHCVLGFSGYS